MVTEESQPELQLTQKLPKLCFWLSTVQQMLCQSQADTPNFLNMPFLSGVVCDCKDGICFNQTSGIKGWHRNVDVQHHHCDNVTLNPCNEKNMLIVHWHPQILFCLKSRVINKQNILILQFTQQFIIDLLSNIVKKNQAEISCNAHNVFILQFTPTIHNRIVDTQSRHYAETSSYADCITKLLCFIICLRSQQPSSRNSHSFHCFT